MMTVSYLVVSCCLVGQLLPLIQGQTFSNILPPTCNPPTALPNLLLTQPYYPQFLPAVEPYVEIDNECYTACPLVGGDRYHYLLYQSRVYTNGTNEVFTYLQHFNSSGVIFLDSPQCRVVDIIFDQTSDGTYLNYRCFLGAGCNHFNTDPCKVPVCGLSSTYGRGRMDSQYYDDVYDTLERLGYPYQEYVFMPMNLQPQCVTCPNCALP